MENLANHISTLLKLINVPSNVTVNQDYHPS
jgi:hypothetical protein